MKEFFRHKTFSSFVAGEFAHPVKSLHSQVSQVTHEIREISFANLDLVHKAIDSAQNAQVLLKNLSAYDRAKILDKISDLLIDNCQELALLISTEMGKPIREARSEVEYAAGYFSFFAEESKRIFGYSIPSEHHKLLEVRYEPIGVCAAITPWNFPIAMAARKIAPALAAACPIIVKPSSDTPLTLLALAFISKEAGLPLGCLQVLVGDSAMIGDALLASPIVRKLAFTGSCDVGRQLYSKCVPTFKKATLELGGHAPLLVFDDADLNVAVKESVAAKFRISGQTCICANRLLIQKGIFNAFMEAFVKQVRQMRVGNPLEESTDLSNVLHPTSLAKVPKHISDAIAKGAKLILGGKEPYEPTILSGVTPEMLIFREETFGPVAAMTCFEDEEEGLSLANDCEYGLASYLFTQNLNRAQRVISQLEYGIIGLNDGLPSTHQAPFGGIKNSGFGREGGPRSIYEYLTEKFVSQKL